MNAIIFALALAALAGSSVNAVHNTVASCAELASINSATTSITITSSPLACTNYTRILVSNDMVLSATVPNVLFSNVAFEVSGELTLEPSVEFTGITDEVVLLELEVLCIYIASVCRCCSKYGRGWYFLILHTECRMASKVFYLSRCDYPDCRATAELWICERERL